MRFFGENLNRGLQEQVVRECNTCIQFCNRCHKPKKQMYLKEIAKKFMGPMAVDVFKMPKLREGHESELIILERYSRFVWARAFKKLNEELVVK
jgi:hypothetical protein